MEVPNLWERIQPRLQEQLRQGLGVQQVAAFCKVGDHTVRDWELNRHPPQGARLARLWCLLDFFGSESPELQGMPQFNRLLVELFSFEVIDLEEACEIANTKHTQNVFKIMRGQPASHPRLTVDELLELYGSALEDAKRRLGSPQVREPESPPYKATDETPEPSQDNLALELPHGDPKLVLATLLGAALPLARHLDSKQTPAQERAAFRDLVGQENLFHLSNLLNSLCSERARTHGR